ncbi:MAG TPA: PAS domain S-box protein, partial [Bryobacteraceae bacterium]|nr:PAS domain S-box protein [Bryobacteraceae bacterium]
DLVITDIVMPNLDGGELAKRMQADPELSAIPILFYSAAYSERQAKEVAREVGAVGVIPKPSDPEFILTMVNETLGVHSPYVPETGIDLGKDWSAASALIELSLELASERIPGRRLERLAHLARKLIGARYSAVGLLSADGQTVQSFLSSGVDRGNGVDPADGHIRSADAQFTALLPPGGMLSNLLRDPRPLWLGKVEAPQLCNELPGISGWSGVVSVLVVPFVASQSLRGWLILADKLGAESFTEVDARMVITLASQGVSAYEIAEERLQAEDDLRKSKAMFEALFESAPDAMLASDKDGRIVFANSQSEKMFSYSRSELLGRPIETLVPKRFHGVHSAHRRGYCHDPRLRPMGIGKNLYAKRSDGSEFPVDIMLSPMDAASGVLVLSVVRDVTVRAEIERKILDLNRQLHERVKELHAANQSLETFSYSISHDLRAPLRAIEGFSSILSDEYAADLDPEAHRLLGVISTNCHKMGQLIEDLLAFSRLSANEAVRSEIDMTALARSVVDELRAMEPGRLIEIELHPLPQALGERAVVRQVLMNLISNAWKFTRHAPRPAIEVGSYRDGGRDVYFVEDNGVGFDPQYSDKLFRVFERLHGGDEFEGSGIGLAIVRRISRRHGGEAWATGKVGQGAKFCFTLAAAPPATDPPDGVSGKGDKDAR